MELNPVATCGTDKEVGGRLPGKKRRFQREKDGMAAKMSK